MDLFSLHVSFLGLSNVLINWLTLLKNRNLLLIIKHCLQSSAVAEGTGDVLRKKVLYKISQISKKITCALRPATLLKRGSNTDIFL